MLLKVVDEFTDCPGARYRRQGKYSAEEFLETLLIPKFLDASKRNETLTIDMDGAYGYAGSFINEAFVGLYRYIHNNYPQYITYLSLINIISDEMPDWKPKIKAYLNGEV